ncbi:MAG: sigma-70 family RNA polymerase sigma factor [Planctomycetota bacterium]|nr:sigma-70 family RNA polymerase sigma factor [Planctomycetota bacterium]
MTEATTTNARCDADKSVPIAENSDPRSDAFPLMEETRRVLKSLPIEIPDSFRGRVDKSDLVQDVLLKISENDYGLEAMQPRGRRAFLRKMLSSRVVDVMRTHLSFKRDVRREQRLEKDVSGPDSTPSSVLNWSEQQNAIQAALEQLPVDDQTVLRLRHRDGLTFVQIGESMGRSPDSVRNLWGRALVRLANCLDR